MVNGEVIFQSNPLGSGVASEGQLRRAAALARLKEALFKLARIEAARFPHHAASAEERDGA
jgi:hypothetical protein